LIRSISASAFVVVLGATALLPLTFASCQKVIGLPEKQPTFGASEKCEEYCALAATTCMGDPANQNKGGIYGSDVGCLNFCAKLEGEDYRFTEGESEMLLDPIACRVDRLKNPENMDTACFLGSPTGSASCGDMCELYCKLYSDVCKAACEDDPSKCTVFPEDVCQTQCAALRVDGQARSLPGGTYDQKDHYDGDNLQCRFLHLVNAITDPSTHCGHSAFKSNLHCFEDDPDP
jgi:hypothetical protein